MNKDNARNYLPLVQALADGKTIQCLREGEGWVDLGSVRFDFDAESYRIKPEPSQESIQMASYLEEMAKSIRQMKIQPHDITNIVSASGCGTIRKVTFIYTEKA